MFIVLKMIIPKNLLKTKNFEEFMYYMGMPTKKELKRVENNLKKNGFYTPKEIQEKEGKIIIKPKNIPEYMMMFGFKEVKRNGNIVSMEFIKRLNDDEKKKTIKAYKKV